MSGSIETLNANILLLIAAVEANTAAMSGSAPVKGADAKAGTTKAGTTKASTTKNEKPKSKYTKQEVCDVITAVKNTLGAPAARALLSDHGFAKLADITEDKFDALYESGKDQLPNEEEAADDNDI